MTMRPEQAKALIMHLGRLEKTKCPVCGNDDPTRFQSGDILKVPIITPSGATAHSPGHEGAMAQLNCKMCGYALLFDCKLAGVPV